MPNKLADRSGERRFMDTVVRVAKGGLRSSTRTPIVVLVLVVGTPPILLADEPTGNLDEATSDQLIALLRRMTQSSGLSVVLVTHNPRIAAKADHVVRLNSGRVESDRRHEDRRARSASRGRPTHHSAVMAATYTH
jgi:ABC-type sulfate/molybdate transport systems ATPase subunit